MPNIQKCSGRWCDIKETCTHYIESLKKTKVKGRWINSEFCTEYVGKYTHFEKVTK